MTFIAIKKEKVLKVVVVKNDTVEWRRTGMIFYKLGSSAKKKSSEEKKEDSFTD